MANAGELETLRLIDRALRSIDVLDLHKRAVNGEYNERAKRLKAIIRNLQSRDADSLPLDGADSVQLSEDDERLVLNPTEGL